jgi:hypothetical protein
MKSRCDPELANVVFAGACARAGQVPAYTASGADVGAPAGVGVAQDAFAIETTAAASDPASPLGDEEEEEEEEGDGDPEEDEDDEDDEDEGGGLDEFDAVAGLADACSRSPHPPASTAIDTRARHRNFIGRVFTLIGPRLRTSSANR